MKRAFGVAAAVSALLGAFAVSPASAIAPPTTGQAHSVGAHPEASPACTVHVSDARAAKNTPAGAVICVDGDFKDKRLEISEGGTAGKPKTYSGKGQTVSGIDVDADYVIVDGYTLNQPSAPGIEVHGKNDTIQNNVITAPKGGDGDGMRFFGNNLTIQHNTVSKTDNSTGAHADCMQTFATGDDDVASQHLLIDSNRCENVDNMCLIGEGPNSEAGDGSGIGVSEDWTFSNNYCQTLEANQTVFIDDIQHLTITGNTWVKGGINHAIGIQNKSTDAHIKDNKLDPSIDCEVGIDSSSMKGYQGPKPKCDP